MASKRDSSRASLLAATLVGFFFVSVPAFGAVTYVKKIEAVVVASSNAVSTASFGSAVTSGDLIVVRVWYNDPARAVLTVTDSKGNTYTRAAGPTTGPSGMTSWRQELWYGKNVVGGTGLSVTATFDASFTTEKSVSAYEYAGADAVSPLDAVAATTTSSANASSGAVSTSSAAELIVGAALFGNCGNAGSGFTVRSSLNCNIVEDKAVTTAGSYAATFSSSAQAAIVQVATFKAAGQVADTTPPSMPTALSPSVVSSSQINLSWTASTDNVGVVSYRVYRNSVQIGTVTATTYADSGLASSTTYTYAVAAVDAAGNISALSTSVNATTPAGADTTPPSAPTNLAAAAVSSSAITLTWTASTDNVAVASYNVYRASALIASVTTTSYSDTGLVGSTKYTYAVAAVDPSGNVSALSRNASAKTLAPPDTSAPSVPNNLTATALSASDVALAWTASVDNVAVAGYKVYRGTTQIATIGGTAFLDTGLDASTAYTYTVAAFDAAGNSSAPSSSATATTQAAPFLSYTTAFPLTENPIAEGGLWLGGSTAGGNLWGDVRTASGLAFGVIEPTQFGDPTAILQGSWGPNQTAQATVKINTTPTGNCCREVEVRLRNTITPNSITGYEVYCSVMPGNPYCHIASWGGPNGAWVNMEANSPALYLKDGDVLTGTVTGTNPVTIRMFINGAPVLTVQDTGTFRFSDGRQYGPWTTGGPGFGFYDDQDANWSWFGLRNFTATSNAPIDTQAPSTPTGLVANPISTSEVDLSWLPAADNIGTAGYTVYRNGSAAATVTGTTFASLGLTASTAYTFTVAAFDAAGNTSPLSAPVTITTLAPPPDITPPTVPSGLTAAAPSSTAMILTWSPSTDNVGVAGYRVFRGGIAVANVTTGTSFTDQGLNGSTTYTYQVAAYDAASNMSSPSASRAATTPGAALDAGLINAASCSSADVQAAIDATQDGFTVFVPSGTCVWIATPGRAAVAVAQKSITLQGAGIGQTSISADVAGGLAAMLYFDAGTGKAVRLTGFTLSTASPAMELVAISGASPNIRIDHSRFDAAAGATAVHVAGALYGVVDHNTFHNARAIVEDDGDGSWQRPLNLGGADALYFEDNVFQFDVPVSAMGGRGGSRYVFRHNVANVGIQDDSSCDTGIRGARRIEIYDNAFASDTMMPPAPIVLRGGTGVVFGNTVSGTFGATAIVVDDPRSDAVTCAGIWAAHPTCDGLGPYDGNAAGSSGYLCRDQIGASSDAGLSTPQAPEPMFAWNNTSATGDLVAMVAGGGTGTAEHVQLNRDFFNSAKTDYVEYAYPHPFVLSGPDLIPPAVAMTSPQTGATVAGGVTLSAAAVDNVAVASVSFAADGVALGPPLLAAPYTIVWDAASVTVGAHTLTATAVDGSGNSTTSAAVIVYVPDTTPPVIGGLAEQDTSIAGATISWSTDEPSDGQVVFAGGPCPYVTQCVGSLASPLVTAHAIAITGLAPATSYTYSVTSKDAAGNLSTSPPRTFATPLDTTAPTVSIASPTGTVSGASVQVSATATDDVAVVGVQFMLDGTALGAESTTSPWAVIWNSTQVANGSHVLTASARDAAGNVALSAGITVTVNNDLTRPAVTITAPASGASVAGTISVTATASDNVGVAGVTFAVDGTTIGAEVKVAPFAMSWNTTTVANGAHVVSAIARDAAGNTASSAVTVIVANPISSYPSSYSITTGTHQSGNTASLTADDNNYLVAKSVTSGSSSQTVTDYTLTQAVAGSRVDYSVRLKTNASSTTVVVFARNYTSGTWTQLTSATVGTSELTLTGKLTSGIAGYVSTSGQMMVRVQTSKGSSHTVSAEMVKVVITP